MPNVLAKRDPASAVANQCQSSNGKPTGRQIASLLHPPHRPASPELQRGERINCFIAQLPHCFIVGTEQSSNSDNLTIIISSSLPVPLVFGKTIDMPSGKKIEIVFAIYDLESRSRISL